MTRRPLAAVLPHLRRLAAAGGDDPADPQLLEQFLGHRDADAFAALVRRHGPMVLAVCRRLLPETHDAEDAFQAAFLVLARRASDVRRPERLGSWLYGVAYRVALKARGREARRRRSEQPLAEVPVEGGVADLVWRDVRPVIDEELSRLPEKYRAPVVLCYLEGVSKRAAARQLGWPEGTLSARLHRAREILRGRLTRRGLALSAGVVAAALSRGAAPAAVPASLTAASVAAPVPAPVTALAEGVLRAMWWNKWKMPAILCTALLLAAGLGRAVLPAAPPAPEQRAPSPPPPVADVKKEPAAAKTFPLGKDVRRVVWSPDGKLMASQALRSEPRKDGGEGEMDWFSTVRVWDAATGKEVTSLGELKNSGLIGVAFSPDGGTLALSFFRQIEEGAKFELWDARKGELKKTFEMDYGRVVPRVAFAPDGKTLAVLYAGDTDRDRKLEDLNGGVRLFDVTTGKAVRTIRGHKHMAICLAFSPDGKLLATGGSQNDNDIRVWDVATGKELHRIETDRAVQAVAFSPDGKVLLGGEGARGTIASWDVVSGKRLRSLKYVMDDILTLTFSHDGKFLAVAYSEEKDAKRRVTTSLIDMAVGGDDRVTDPVGRWDDTTASLAFTADGRQLAILGRDGTLSLWDVKGLRKPAADPKADYGFGKLIDQLIEAKKTDNEVAEALYLAVLGCYPEERERKFVAGRLAEHKDRREAMVDTVWLLINSKEFWAHLDVLKEHDSREAFKKE